MNGIKVVFYSGARRIEGILTTEHSASHGIPVFIDENGSALCPAETDDLVVVGRKGTPEFCLTDESGYCDASDFYRRAMQAGYKFSK